MKMKIVVFWNSTSKHKTKNLNFPKDIIQCKNGRKNVVKEIKKIKLYMSKKREHTESGISQFL